MSRVVHSFFVFCYRLRKLVGAGGAVAAEHAAQNALKLVYVAALGKFCHALRVARAAACKFYVVNFVLAVHVEADRARACSLCFVSKHSQSERFSYITAYRSEAFSSHFLYILFAVFLSGTTNFSSSMG